MDATFTLDEDENGKRKGLFKKILKIVKIVAKVASFVVPGG